MSDFLSPKPMTHAASLSGVRRRWRATQRHHAARRRAWERMAGCMGANFQDGAACMHASIIAMLFARSLVGALHAPCPL